MPDARYATCKSCGRGRDEVGELSWSRLCVECGQIRLAENLLALTTMSGPNAKHWRRRMAASVGAVLLDDVQPAP